MRKENLYKFFNFVAAVMLVLLLVRGAADVFTYDPAGSMPLRMILAGRVFQFGIPGILSLIASGVARKKYNKE